MAENKNLTEEIFNSKKTLVEIAEDLNISKRSLYNKIEGKTDFKLMEFIRLCKILQLSRDEMVDIFLKYEDNEYQSDEERARQELKEMGLIKE